MLGSLQRGIWQWVAEAALPASGERPRRAALLDRDGVINAMWLDPDHGLVDSPATPEQFRLLHNAAEAIRRLKASGFLCTVVSNQPGVAKGRFTMRLLEATTAKMLDLLQQAEALPDAVFYCLHHPDAELPEYRVPCVCRKPRPGLLIRAGEILNLDLPRSYTVGDGLTDIRAGRDAACRTIWIGRPKPEVCRVMADEDSIPDYIVGDLLQAVQLIEREENKRYGDIS